ncbi:MAG: cation:proton antiporter [Actinomycetota bacterium]|nr:cation:proton antiporter [Actinomycetota bacterium]
MEHELALGLAAVVVVGVAAQWVATLLRIPTILLLLAAGVLAGPVSGVVVPRDLLGELLFPLVSLAVGVLLFEGGLGLQYRDIRDGQVALLRLITVGTLITWVIGWVAAAQLLDANRGVAALIGAVLVVSGPTVVLPLLRQARPREPSASILRWEGIIIDPIGATLAIVVLEAVLSNEGLGPSIGRIIATGVAGTVAGLVGAGIMIVMLERHLVADRLHNAFTLMVVVAAFEAANLLRPEAGLFATTVMGVALANQRRVPMRHIREFEEDLGTLILSGLFILLGASISLDAVADLAPRAILLALVLIFVARPLAVYASTLGTSVPGRHRLYLCFMAPRGIVAAAVSAVFALDLQNHPEVQAAEDADLLVPGVFVVIVCTVAFYGLLAGPAASWLRIARAQPRAIALIGGERWALDLAEQLMNADVAVLVVSPSPTEARRAAERGMLTFSGRLDSEDLELALDTVGVAQAIALSRTADLNAFGMNRLVDHLGRRNIYHLPPTVGEPEGEATHSAVFGRRPFSPDASQRRIRHSLGAGGRFILVDETSWDDTRYANALPLVTIDGSGLAEIQVGATPRRPERGGRLVLLTATNGFEDEAGDGEDEDEEDGIEPLRGPDDPEDLDEDERTGAADGRADASADGRSNGEATRNQPDRPQHSRSNHEPT